MSEQQKNDDGTDPRLDEALREAWAAPVAPPGFADAVLTARDAAGLPPESPARSPRRWREHLLPMTAAAAAAAIVISGAQHWLIFPSSGGVTVDERTEVEIGDRARIVAEAGADLVWSVQMGGRTTVEQSKGDVFYRVESGEAFEVKTPAGSVRVQGTCFRVQVTPEEESGMSEQQKSRRSGALVGALAGAVIGAGVVVTVYEGGVVLAHDGAEVSVGAGEVASAGAERAPRKMKVLRAAPAGAPGESPAPLLAERDTLKHRVGTLEAQLSSLQETGEIAPQLLEKENLELREQLAALRREAKARQAEDQSIPFPEELEPRYQEAALMAAFQEALAAGSIPGDVRAIDCSEYPCIVHGEFTGGGDEDDLHASVTGLEAQLAEQYPDDESDTQMMVSRMKKRNEEGEEEMKDSFAVTITPRAGEEEPEKASLRSTRIRERVGQYFQSTLGK